MGQEPFGLLELGSNSLKFYLVVPGNEGTYSVETHRRPWNVAHDFFAAGRLSESTIEEIIEALRSSERHSRGVRLSTMIGIATGVFRELEDLPTVTAHVGRHTGLRIRVISGEDEARLMAKCLPAEKRQGVVVLCDLGGATLQWTWIEDGKTKGWGSQPLGAIRNEYEFRHLRTRLEEYLRESTKYCDERLLALPVLDGGTVLATGGTARAAAQCLGHDRIAGDSLRRLLEEVLCHGAPSHLGRERQVVFLPGLVILERVLTRCRAEFLECAEISVRDGLTQRLIRALATHRRSQLHATLLLGTHWP